MFRALIMWLANPVYEVRLISTKSGKDIPGRCLYKGGYFKARKVWRGKKLKYGELIRLQAVSCLEWRANDVQSPSETVQPPAGMEHVQVAPGITEGRRIEPGRINIESNPGAGDDRFKDEFMRTHVEGEFPAAEENTGDHECNSDGPLEWMREAHMQPEGYYPTCSICGQSEDI